MSERGGETPHETCSLNTLLSSFTIFLRNPRIFFSIFALTTLPLSLLLFALSLLSHPIKSQIYQLEALALLAPTRFESRHVWKESRENALSLLRLKAFFFLPCYALSLLASITAVNSAALACSGKRPSLGTAVTAVRQTWKRPLVTTIYVYAIMLAYVHVPRTIAALVGAAVARLVVAVLGAALEVYLMAVLSVALVVSVVEERFGWDAIRVGSNLMEGRRLCGWVLSGFIVSVSCIIGWELEGFMDGRDFTVMGMVMGFGDKVGLVCLFGLVVLWSYVVTTVYYCECSRRRHVSKEENEMITV